MKRMLIRWVVASGLLLAGAVHAEDLPGASVIASPAIDQWWLIGNGQSHRMMKDQTIAGGYAFVVKTPAAGDNPWDVQAGVNTTQAVHTGDVLLLAFWARALATPPGQPAISVVADLQQNHTPYTRLGEQTLTVGQGWKLYYVTGTAGSDFAPGEVAATVELATGAQEIALGPVFVRDFGPGYDLAKLPVN